MQTIRLLTIIFFFQCILLAAHANEQYNIEFIGVQDQSIFERLKASSQSVSLRDKLPETLSALRRRAEADIENLQTALQSMAYYDAKVRLEMDSSSKPITIRYIIDPGPVYPLESFDILPTEGSPPYPYDQIPLDLLGITIDAPAYPKTILEAESKVIKILSERGYPFAKLGKSEIVADQQNSSIHVTFFIDRGPIVYFGETEITGTETVKLCFIRNKISWKVGQRYDPKKIQCTLDALEASRLFKSVSISYDESPVQDHVLPITIQIEEAKHRSVGFGLSFSTQRGFGIPFEWEHRNIRGIGETLRLDSNLAQKIQEIKLSYIQPELFCPKEDLIWLIEYEHEKTKGFTETFLSVSARLDREICQSTRFSYGLMFKFLSNEKSDNNRDYYLFKTPLQLWWTNAKDLLDPKSGQSLIITNTPSYQFVTPSFFYDIHTVSAACYFPLTKDKRFILATKGMFGTILGPSRQTIPPSERFYAGSETTLRGYEYFTVSPLSKDRKPIGGNSLMIFSLEGRWQFTDSWGTAVFWDRGNVYAGTLPKFSDRVLNSLGIGVRYYTPVGPLRFDIAFPLNPRPKIDSLFQIYFSVGQTF